jgi:hypothetical protein
MLKQNDIVLFRNNKGEFQFGIIRGKPGTNPAPNEYTIYTLSQEDGTEKYMISGKS